MRSDKTLQALFGEDRDFQVTTVVSPTGGGTVTGAGSYHFGEEACVVAEAADGYHFVQWNDGDLLLVWVDLSVITLVRLGSHSEVFG